jgi:hypothetical protein
MRAVYVARPIEWRPDRPPDGYRGLCSGGHHVRQRESTDVVPVREEIGAERQALHQLLHRRSATARCPLNCWRQGEEIAVERHITGNKAPMLRKRDDGIPSIPLANCFIKRRTEWRMCAEFIGAANESISEIGDWFAPRVIPFLADFLYLTCPRAFCRGNVAGADGAESRDTQRFSTSI